MPQRPAHFTPKATEHAIRDVRAVYADLEAHPQPRSCIARTQCCQFRLTGKTPMLTMGEALVAAQGVRAAGRTSLPESADPATGRCPLLGQNGRCTIYEHRPFGCRTHFCSAAGGPYSRKSVQPHIHRLEAIAESLGHTDPRPLADAIQDALTRLPRKARRNPGTP